MKAVFIGGHDPTREVANLAIGLRWPDASVTAAATAEAGLKAVEQESPDVVLVHPDFTDLTLAQTIPEILNRTSAPILVFGSQADEMEVITSLELGADDYIRLPCALAEIMIRIHALLRRANLRDDQESSLPDLPLAFDPADYEAILGGRRIALTLTESRMLDLLVTSRGSVVTYRSLETLFGECRDKYGMVKKYIQRLREKLGDNARDPRWIATLHGVGYRFIGPPTSQVRDGSGVGQDI